MGIFDMVAKLKSIQFVLSTKRWNDSARNRVIKVRVTDEEYEAFKLLGKSMGMSSLIRYAVLDLYLNKFLKDYS
ncbi:MAG: hypothetical protein ACRDA4_08235 [Filifactoraceae bacterium]